MIIIDEIIPKEIDVRNSYVLIDDHIAYIETELLTDSNNCAIREISDATVITLTDRKQFAEIECLFCQIEQVDCLPKYSINNFIYGNPVLRIEKSLSKILVQTSKREGFIIWLEYGRNVDTVISCSGILFLCEQNRLIGIMSTF